MNFNSIEDLIIESERRLISIGQLVKEWEAEKKEISITEVEEKMRTNWGIMKESIILGINNPQKSMGGLIGGEGRRLHDYCLTQKTLSGNLVNLAVARALAVLEVNASMGKIVAAPTAGSSGIIPGVLLTMQEHLGVDDDRVIDALFTSSGFGIIIAQKASVSGAAGGCQAECGSAAGMIAASVVELSGGSPRQAGHACAMVLKNILGLICDPVAGLVEVPCAKRNALGASLSLTCADMALAGIKSVIPIDEVIVTMGEVGRCLPESLRETSKGGLAVTPTGKKIAKKIFTEKK
ncbi:L-serine ammonia-lyase, iron-sulfur-dependent, subunit alpha [Desulfonispora thiosulfatigenes]|uniref:L-serine ammonia-lyase, iron-sulfur-dependent, subunit alpha n=1 Tax=Desulfonispora thiosulfatigenes TaxID=83661 RepID=UPI003119202A